MNNLFVLALFISNFLQNQAEFIEARGRVTDAKEYTWKDGSRGIVIAVPLGYTEFPNSLPPKLWMRLEITDLSDRLVRVPGLKSRGHYVFDVYLCPKPKKCPRCLRSGIEAVKKGSLLKATFLHKESTE